MNPYGLTWWCELCGGEGKATYNDARYFLSGSMFHRDPRICKEILRDKERQEKKAA